MEKKDFIKLINLIVDKKLSELLPGMVKKEVEFYLQSGIKPGPDDFNKDSSLKDLIPAVKPSNSIIRDNSVSEERSFSKNSVINKILNETAANFQPLPKVAGDISGDYKAMLSGEYDGIENEFTFNSKNMMDVVNRTKSPVKASTNNLKQEILNSGAPPEIANVMIKDYRTLMKKQNDIKKSGKIAPLPGNGIGESW